MSSDITPQTPRQSRRGTTFDSCRTYQDAQQWHAGGIQGSSLLFWRLEAQQRSVRMELSERKGMRSKMHIELREFLSDTALLTSVKCLRVWGRPWKVSRVLRCSYTAFRARRHNVCCSSTIDSAKTHKKDPLIGGLAPDDASVVSSLKITPLHPSLSAQT